MVENLYLDLELFLDPPTVQFDELKKELNEKIQEWNKLVFLPGSKYKHMFQIADAFCGRAAPPQPPEATLIDMSVEARKKRETAGKQAAAIYEEDGILEQVAYDALHKEFSPFFKKETIDSWLTLKVESAFVPPVAPVYPNGVKEVPKVEMDKIATDLKIILGNEDANLYDLLQVQITATLETIQSTQKSVAEKAAKKPKSGPESAKVDAEIRVLGQAKIIFKDEFSRQGYDIARKRRPFDKLADSVFSRRVIQKNISHAGYVKSIEEARQVGFSQAEAEWYVYDYYINKRKLPLPWRNVATLSSQRCILKPDQVNEHNVYGIDLGTTNSSIAYINEEGRPEIIMNSDGCATTPSVVYFESPTSVVVGRNAKSAGALGPEAAQRVVSFVKTQMSNKEWTFPIDGKEYCPVEISSLIIRKLAEDAKKHVGHDVKDVVITCPAYFGEMERYRTRQAGEIAGLNVLTILDEPVAAALCYGLENANLRGKNVLVYRLGGGTFDATVISFGDDSDKMDIRIICTDGSHQRGGKDWDDMIVRYYLEEFEKDTGVDIMQGESQDVHELMCDLQIAAEHNKQTLTILNEIKHKIVFDGTKAIINLTREKFEEITADLLEQTIYFTDRVLETAKEKSVSKIDTFLLVGGSTRMPQVQKRLSEKYFLTLDETLLYADHVGAIAKGAAKAAEITKIKTLFFPSVSS